MKKLILFICVFISTYTYSQISYVSKDKDTLILPMDRLGIDIFKTWYDYPKHERPIILFSNYQYINILNENKNRITYTNSKIIINDYFEFEIAYD